jgi:hypothetical protein
MLQTSRRLNRQKAEEIPQMGHKHKPDIGVEKCVTGQEAYPQTCVITGPILNIVKAVCFTATKRP